MTKELQHNSFYQSIEKFHVCKNKSEKLGPGFKLILTFAQVFVIAFVFFMYIALWHEENSLLNANDGLCQAISEQLAFSASIPITTERDFFKGRLILRHYVKGLRD
jgi:uncharacterized membrane protein